MKLLDTPKAHVICGFKGTELKLYFLIAKLSLIEPVKDFIAEALPRLLSLVQSKIDVWATRCQQM